MKVVSILLAATLVVGFVGPVSAASGEKLFRIKCMMCHSLEEGKKKMGPSLYGLMGRSAGTLEGYKFSKALKNNGFEWTEPLLDVWLKNPKELVPKTRMKTQGIKKEGDRKALIEYLKKFSPEG